jgi:hypothetical protein
VVVQLMVAILGAVALARLRRRPGGTAWVTAAAFAGLLLDYWPAARPLWIVERSMVHERLASLPPGPVLELPFGHQDGFGRRGRPDPRALLFQSAHGHPLFGGLVSRLSRRVRDAYEADPVLRPLLDASEGLPARPPEAAACPSTLACDARYVIVSEHASGELQQLAAAMFEMELVEGSPSASLYSVAGLRTCACGTGAR